MQASAGGRAMRDAYLIGRRGAPARTGVKRKEEGMPRYGSSWDERRQQSSDYQPDQGRWRGEQQETRGGQDESWRENRGEQFGQGREDWRQRFGRGDDWRGSEDRGPIQRLGDKFREMTGMQMRGPKGYKRSDDRVSDEVCERIARSGVDAENVEVKVQAGEVTLTGTVRNRQEKWRLEELAEDVFGVQDVHNNLRVSREQQGSRTGQPENKPSVRH
jgi:HSP20 family molecular chaperone IbpA